MIRAHKIELYPSLDQKSYLVQAMGAKRHLYNQLYFYFNHPDHPVKWSVKAARAYYHSIKSNFPWYNQFSYTIFDEAIADLDSAYKHFFRRLKQGVKPFGYPKPAVKGINESFRIRDKRKFTTAGREFRFEKFNKRQSSKALKLREIPRYDDPTSMTVSQKAGKFFSSFSYDVDIEKPNLEGEIGVDLGIKELAVLSDGTVVKSNDRLKKSLKRMKRKQRRLSRARKGSKRRARAKLSIQKLHYRITNQRKAVLHKLTNLLTLMYKYINVEDLNVKGMSKNHNLARSIMDAGWGEFRCQLKYKCAARGNILTIIDRFYPSSKTCSCCGNIQIMPLKVRTYECSDCGMMMDRDLNAAINICQKGKEMRTDCSPSINPTRPDCVRLDSSSDNRYESVDKSTNVVLVAL